MRDIINLVETPISDFEFIDRSDQPPPHTPGGDSFRADDKKALQSEKWRAKLVHAFRNTPEPINVYAFNSKYLQVFVDGEANSTTPQYLLSMETWAGPYDPADFQETFGFLPPDYESSLNFLFVQNEGDERLPLTPWMVAHRMIHALLNEQQDVRRGRRDYHMTMDRAFRHASQMMTAIRDAYGKTVSVKVGQISYFDPKHDPDIFAAISTLNSAKNRSIVRSGEFIIELFTQFFLTGDFKIDLTAVKPSISDEENIRYHERKCKELLNEGILEAVGELIVF